MKNLKRVRIFIAASFLLLPACNKPKQIDERVLRGELIANRYAMTACLEALGKKDVGTAKELVLASLKGMDDRVKLLKANGYLLGFEQCDPTHAVEREREVSHSVDAVEKGSSRRRELVPPQY